MVKRLPAMRETRVQSLGWEDHLEKEMATLNSMSALGSPTFYSSGEGKLGVALESLQGQRDLI